MNIILIGTEVRSLDYLKLMLKKRGVNSSIILNTLNYDFFSEEFNKIMSNSHAIVIDRVLLSELDMKIFSKFQLFFIVGELEDVKNLNSYVDNKNSCKIRFYFCPVNVELLADDLISIIGSKLFMISEKIFVNDLEIDSQNHTVSKEKKVIFLKNKEFELLFYLAKHRGKVVSRGIILEHVWDMNTRVMTNTVDVHISKIRKIIKTSFGINGLIQTIPCCGYIIP